MGNCLITKLKGSVNADLPYFIPPFKERIRFTTNVSVILTDLILRKGHYRITIFAQSGERVENDYIRLMQGSNILKNVELSPNSTFFMASDILDVTEDISNCSFVMYCNNLNQEYIVMLEYFYDYKNINLNWEGVAGRHINPNPFVSDLSEELKGFILKANKTYKLEVDYLGSEERTIEDYFSVRDKNDTVLNNIRLDINTTHAEHTFTTDSVVDYCFIRPYSNVVTQNYRIKYYEI